VPFPTVSSLPAAVSVSVTLPSDVMIPLLRDAGVDAGTLARLTKDNPFRANSRPGPVAAP
jgi:predicted metal-dependent phosphotriesterase family hydrolase